MIKILTNSTVFLIGILISYAQVNDKATYTAYIGLQSIQDTKTQWEKTVAAKQHAYDSNKGDSKLQFNLALAQFGLLSSTMRDRDEKLFDKYYKINEDHWQTLIKKEKDWSEVQALLSALYGLKMGYSPMQGMALGPKSGMLLEKARDRTPSSPVIWKVYANSKLFTPSLFGGDIAEAIKAFERSIELFEAKHEELKYNWWYLDAMIFLGQAYGKDGQISKAIEIYEKALKVEPDLGWVKYSLLPKAKEKALEK